MDTFAQHERARLKAVLDATSDFAIAGSRVTSAQHFETACAKEPFCVMPDSLVESCRRLLEADICDMESSKVAPPPMYGEWMRTTTALTASLLGYNVRHWIPRHRQSPQYVFENAQRCQHPPRMEQLPLCQTCLSTSRRTPPSRGSRKHRRCCRRARGRPSTSATIPSASNPKLLALPARSGRSERPLRSFHFGALKGRVLHGRRRAGYL